MLLFIFVYAFLSFFFFFFFNDTATTEIYTSSHTLSLHDALPISAPPARASARRRAGRTGGSRHRRPRPPAAPPARRSEEHTSELQSRELISYAVFCLKKKKIYKHISDQFHVTYKKK